MTLHGLDPNDPDLRLMSQIMEGMLREFVESGDIKIGSKPLPDILAEFATLLGQFTADMAASRAHGEDGWHVDLDHRFTLLDYAKRETEAGQDEIAVTFCALWVEHTVNGCLIRGFQRKGYGQETIKPLLRELSIKTKMTALWHIAGFPPLSDEDTRLADQIAQARNSFIHYKYPSYDYTARKTVESQLRSIVERSPDLIAAFEAAMNTLYWDGREDEIISFVREKNRTELGWLVKYHRRQGQSETDG